MHSAISDLRLSLSQRFNRYFWSSLFFKFNSLPFFNFFYLFRRLETAVRLCENCEFWVGLDKLQWNFTVWRWRDGKPAVEVTSKENDIFISPKNHFWVPGAPDYAAWVKRKGTHCAYMVVERGSRKDMKHDNYRHCDEKLYALCESKKGKSDNISSY